jgi:hypothetical protein
MKYFAVLLAGLVVGGLLTYFLLVGAPRMEKPPGEPVRPPGAEGPPAGSITLAFDEQFFNTLLEAIFRDVGSPAFSLAAGPRLIPVSPDGGAYLRAQGGCESRIEIVSEGSGGARTGVRLQGGEVVAPLAFRGNYAVPIFGCINFSGTADAQIAPYFNRDEQTLYGQINVRSVALDNVAAQYSPLLTSLVQTAINQRINPITIMGRDQLNIAMPIQAAGGTVRGHAREVRSEVKDSKLLLYVTYDFAGGRGAATVPTS